MGCGAGTKRDTTDPGKKEEKKSSDVKTDVKTDVKADVKKEEKKEQGGDGQHKCIIIIGAPASGKGTQAEMIKEKFQFL